MWISNLERVVILLMTYARCKHRSISRKGQRWWPTSALSFKWVSTFSMVMKTPGDSTTYSAPALPHLMLVGSCFLWWQVSHFHPWLYHWIYHGWNHTGLCRPHSQGQWRIIDGNNIPFARVERALATRYPIWPNTFTLTFTIVSQGPGWQCIRSVAVRWGGGKSLIHLCLK